MNINPNPARLGRVIPRISPGISNMIQERRTWWVNNARRVARSSILASVLAVILFFVLVVLRPVNDAVTVKVLMPERQIELLPEPAAPPKKIEIEAPKELTMQSVIPRPPTEAEKQEELIPRTRRNDVPLDPERGKKGRVAAEQATRELAKASTALDRSLGDLAKSLSSTSDVGSQPTRGRRSRNVRAGRGDGQLASVDAGDASAGAAPDAGGGVKGNQVAIGSLTAADAGTVSGAGEVGTAPGANRTNASLLAIIQKYAAGIQYCYSNELKRDPTLRGKMIVAIAVGPDGQVVEATVVRNTVESKKLESCALSQIREWKFPKISSGVTTFQAPFVFTPPD